VRRTALALSLAAGTLAVLTAAPALADTTPTPPTPAPGPVVIFSTEFQPLTVYANPQGCVKLPLGAHVLANLTDKTVTTYADPFCAIPLPPPFMSIKPGHGAHVSPVAGSFKVG
jgi:hypothetical protein